MRGTALCCALLLCGGGCSLFLSTSDLTGEEAPDGGPATDGSFDAPATVDDGGRTDTGPASEGGGAFCATLSPAPKHCADFDDGNLLGFFDEVLRDPSNGTTTVVAENGGVRAAIDAAGSCSYARLTKTLPTSGQGMRVRFKVKPNAPWPKDQIFFFLNLEDGLNDCGFLVHLGEAGGAADLHVQWGNPEQNGGAGFLEAPKVGEWSEIGIDFANVTTPTADVTVNGKPVVTSETFPQCAFGSSVYVAMGFHCSSGTAEVQYDDLVIDYP